MKLESNSINFGNMIENASLHCACKYLDQIFEQTLERAASKKASCVYIK